MKQYMYTGSFSEGERIENNFEDGPYAFELDVNVLRESGRNNTIYISKSNRSVSWRFKGTELDITPHIQHLIDNGLVVEKPTTDEHWLVHALNHLGTAETRIGKLNTFQQFSVIRNGIQELVAENERLKKKHSEMQQYQYHGRAKDMPKRLREHFESKDIKFTDTEMVDVVEWVEIELVNRWEAGK